jgi:hypothetical protein
MMDQHPRSEDRLRRQLRGAFLTEQAPEAWVTEALRVPLRNTPRESMFPVILPHLCGLGLLLGLAVALCFRPDIGPAFWSLIRSAGPESLRLPAIPGDLLLPILVTPLMVLFLFQGFRGFPALSRWVHR